MELRIIGDPTKLGTSPLISSLISSTHSLWRRELVLRQPRCLLFKSRKQSHRPFGSTPWRKDPSSSSAAPNLDFLNDIPRRNQPQKPQPPPSSRRKPTNSTTIDGLLQQTFRPNRRNSAAASAESSASAIEAGYKASEYYDMRNKDARYAGSLAKSMRFPEPPINDTALDSLRPQTKINLGAATRAKRTIRADPSLGRTVEIDKDRGVDFGRALMRLETRCAANKIRSTVRQQKFHERPGMKRKRLKSERWRALFKESFRAAVGRVKEMRRKGW